MASTSSTSTVLVVLVVPARKEQVAYEWPAGVQNCSGQLNAACLRPIRQILTPMPAKGVQMAQNCSQSVCLSCLVVQKNAENKALFETRECLLFRPARRKAKHVE